MLINIPAHHSNHLFFLFFTQLLFLVQANSHLPLHFHNYPSQQSGYDVQNPYSYPVRNMVAEPTPCLSSQPQQQHASPIIDNRTSTSTSSMPQQPALPHSPSSSISYVPVQIPPHVVDSVVSHPAANPGAISTNQIASASNPLAIPNRPQNLLQQQRQIINIPKMMPQPNAHQLAMQQAAAQLAATQLASSPKEAEKTTKLPYPTYETDMQVEMKRQMAAAAAQQNIAAWQQAQREQQNSATTTQASHPTLISVHSQPTTTQSKPDSHSLSQLSPDELAAYATRLRQQFQQEQRVKTQPLATSAIPSQNPAIRGQIGSVTKSPVLSTVRQEVTNQLPLAKQETVGNATNFVSNGVSTATALAVSPQNLAISATNQSLQPLPEMQAPFPLQNSSSIMPLQLPFGPAPKLTHEINYCDRRQFDDEQLAALSLKRSDYFIYNTSCAGVFFQCAIGQTFVLKCPSVDTQAFDPLISSCNFKNSIRFCPDYDHVLHCTIRETCTPNEFACCALPQQCIEYSRRCDGHRDCADGEDENNCPSCARDEFACVKSGTCIAAKLRCDGKVDDCADGSNLDEIGCSKNETCLGKFVCDSPTTLSLVKHSTCIEVEKYCDNVKDCPGGEDEYNCRMNDEPATKYLSCENQKQQVRKEQWCDGREDCADGSDEKYCF